MEIRMRKASSMERLSLGPPKAATPEYDTGDVVGAALRQHNTVGSWMSDINYQYEGEDIAGYNQYEDLDERYMPYIDAFDGVKSPGERLMKEAHIDSQIRDRELIASSGWTGIGWSMAAGIFDPVTLPLLFVPIAKAGQGAMKVGAITSGVATVEVGVQEALLHGTQDVRTWEESWMAIGGAVILGGALGGIAGIKPSQFSKEAKQANKIIKEITEGDTTSPLPPDGSSVGARSVLGSVEDEGIDGTTWWIPNISPLVRVLKAPFASARNLMTEMVKHNFTLGKHVKGDVSGTAIETEIVKMQSGMTRAYMEVSQTMYKAMTSDTGLLAAKNAGSSVQGMKYSDFMTEIGKSLQRGDAHEIDEVAKAAKQIRKDVLDPIKKAYQEMGALPEDMQAAYAKSYFPRLYDHKAIQQNLTEWTEQLTEHFYQKGKKMSGKTDEINAELATIQAELAKIKGKKGSKVSRNAKMARQKALIEDRDEAIKFMEAGEDRAIAGQIAQDVTDSIMGSPVGRMNDFIGKTGRLNARVLDISDELLEPYLVTNIETVLQTYLRQTVPELKIRQRLGSMEDGVVTNIDDIITNELSKIRDEANIQIKAATGKKRDKLKKQRDNTLRDMEAMFELQLGRYDIPKGEKVRFANMAKGLRSLVFMANLGMMAVSALPDLARPMMQHGVKPFLQAFPPVFFTFMGEASKIARSDMRQMSIGLDNILSSRIYAIGDIDEVGTKMEKMTRTFARYSGMNQWNTTMKTLAGMVGQNRFLDDSINFAKLSKNRRTRLAKAGINEDMAKRIAKQYELHGSKLGGGKHANTKAWKGDREAARKFENVLHRDVENTIVTPGVADKPLFMNRETGKTIMQFKSFFLAAQNQVLIPLVQQMARKDFENLSGIIFGLSLGMMGEKIRLELSGRGDETKDYNTQDWIRAGLDRSGMATVPMEVFNLSDRIAEGRISGFMGASEGSRYFYRNWMGSLAGPSFGYLQDMGNILSSMVSEGKLSASDMSAIRKVMPYQNLFYTRWLVNHLQEYAIDASGAEDNRRKRRKDQSTRYLQ